MIHSVVAKFGGTSVQSATSIQKIKQIISMNTNINVVVVSAVSGITDLLMEFCKSSSSRQHTLAEKIKQTHLTLAKDLNLSLTDEIINYIDQLNPKINSNALTTRQIDEILSLGEDLSSFIIHAFLIAQGIKIKHINIRDYLITDTHFGKATPDIKEIRKRFASLPNDLCITQGFVGSTYTKQTTTLGRGGSDYSAALIAEAMSVDKLLIYTDVPGVFTMDPNVTTPTYPIKELTFQEMAEMANFGAKILHPATLEPCIRSHIPVQILSTFEPDQPGTHICMTAPKMPEPKIRAITMRGRQILVIVKSLQMLNAYGFLANIFNILAKYKISIDLITTSEVSIALTVDEKECKDVFHPSSKLMQELKPFADIAQEKDLTLLAVIGSGLTVSGVIQKTLSYIQPSIIRLICYGASNSSIGILVKEKDAVYLAKELHKKLIGE
ncbi:Aspartokinase [Candidatus Xenohaliotis californiensis]|uniref:Aspartokinase n=1 Tax=Candidatus Xenohaliotis californiensis TaxID=84677 RepID=A0ABP0EU81_9RICK|nr:Aspartokinase [Candidatus Xenohaliotis californiensis]